METIAVVYPIIESLHALQTKSSDRKMWVLYWILYIAGSFLLRYFGWLIGMPFFILSFYIDIYNEVQLLVVFALVFPKILLVKKLLKMLETDGTKMAHEMQEKAGAAFEKGKVEVLKRADSMRKSSSGVSSTKS